MDGDLKELIKPYEIFELADGETQIIKIEGYQLGTMRIVTAKEPEGKEIKALRVAIPPAIKPTGAPWYDITSQTLIAQLIPYLESEGFQDLTFTITKHGIAPKARFTLSVSS